MPRLDGWAVLRAIKADPELSATPVVMVTIIDEQNLAFSLGAADYLPKPIEWERLKGVMDRYRGGEPCEGVLVVDDDPEARERLRGLLLRDGWPVATAENGKAALEQLAGQRPCLILLDLMMPEMDGFAFLRELRAREEWRSIPVVVLTAEDITAEDRRRLAGRADRVIQKGSMSLRDLAGELRRIVADGDQAGAAAAPGGPG
jgi:CheY-like chemotaxis protein